MKSRALMFITTMTLFAAMAMPLCIVAQEQQQAVHLQHYAVIDLGPVGPASSPGQPYVISGGGLVVGEVIFPDRPYRTPFYGKMRK